MTTRRRLFPEVYDVEGYRRGDQVGQGNTAVVFKATRLTDTEPVAMKFYNPWDYDDAGLGQRIDHERFRREFTSVCNISHANVIRVYESSHTVVGYEASGKPPYLVMELLAGGDLKARMQQTTPPYFARIPGALNQLQQLCEGLAAIHAVGAIHRDVKPANIMFRGDIPVIVDFGFSLLLYGDRLTKTGEFLGTLEYASPEQLASAGHVTNKTDVYSFGVVLYEMLTGRNPHPYLEGMTAKSYMDIRSKVQRIDPKVFDSSVPEELVDLCTGCLSSIADLRDDAESVATKLRQLAAS